MKKLLVVLAPIIIGIGSIGSIPVPASAEPLDLSLYPPITEIIATPGSTLKAPISLTNNSEKSQTLYFRIKLFIPLEDGSINLTDDNNLDKILTLEKNGQKIDNEFKLRPSETANLLLTADIPKEASFSDHYAALLFQTKNEEQPTPSESGAFSKIETGLASNLLLSIRPSNWQPTETFMIKEFSLNQLIFFGQEIRTTLKIENQSPHFARAKGTVIIKDINDNVIEKQELPTQNVLSQTTRNLAHNLPSFSSANLFGKYTAYASVDIEGEILTQTIVFFAIPKKGVGIIIVIMIITVITIQRLRFYRKTRRFGRG